MRILIVSVLSLFICISCSIEPGTYQLTVSGDNLDACEIILQNYTSHASRTPEEVKAVDVSSGKIVFEGKLEAPCMSSLKIGENRTERFVLSNSKVSMTLDPDSLVLSDIDAGYQHEMMLEYNRIMKTDEKQTLYAELRKYKRGSKMYNEVMEKVKELSKDDRELHVKFIEEYPDAMMAPYALWRVYSDIGEDKAIELFHHIDSSLSKQAQYVFVAKTIKAWERSPIGGEVPNLFQSDVKGKTVGLHDFRGQWLLIDFWASWCSPCRAANPKMLDLYNKYHDKGIEFLGVSLDKDAEKWKQAIKDDDLPWVHVSDLNYWDNEISRYFGINSIPSTLLVDPEGRIAAKKLHADELEEKFIEIFKQQ